MIPITLLAIPQALSTFGGIFTNINYLIWKYGVLLGIIMIDGVYLYGQFGHYQLWNSYMNSLVMQNVSLLVMQELEDDIETYMVIWYAIAVALYSFKDYWVAA